jgi:ribonuclease III
LGIGDPGSGVAGRATADPSVGAPADAATEGEAPDGRADDARLAAYAAALGVRFRDLDLLRLALTHRSVLHDLPAAGEGDGPPVRSNERLEFLGDAVLGAIAAEFLYAQDPDADEGALTSRRVALVRAETLVAWAREIELGAHLRLGSGERVSASARDRMLAGAFEAVVGAIWLDRGWAATRRFLRRFLARDAARVIERQAGANPKGRLQEELQERFRLSPVYRTVMTEGPAHARVFTVQVDLAGRPLGLGVGGSKREAQQAAAAAALALLEAGEDPLAAAGPALAHADRPGETIVPPPGEEEPPSGAGGTA